MITADAVASKLSSRLRTADSAVPQPDTSSIFIPTFCFCSQCNFHPKIFDKVKLAIFELSCYTI